MKIQTEQENFWINEFGDNYIDRNKRDHLYPSKNEFIFRHRKKYFYSKKLY